MKAIFPSSKGEQATLYITVGKLVWIVKLVFHNFQHHSISAWVKMSFLSASPFCNYFFVRDNPGSSVVFWYAQKIDFIFHFLHNFFDQELRVLSAEFLCVLWRQLFFSYLQILSPSQTAWIDGCDYPDWESRRAICRLCFLLKHFLLLQSYGRQGRGEQSGLLLCVCRCCSRLSRILTFTLAEHHC